MKYTICELEIFSVVGKKIELTRYLNVYFLFDS